MKQAKLEYEVHQAAAQVVIANECFQANEAQAQAQLRLQEQALRSNMLISELRRALQETADQAIVNTRTASELEVRSRKELLEYRHRLAELESAWEMFIDKHNDVEEARDQEQRRRRAAVAVQPSERRIRGSEDASNRVDLRLATCGFGGRHFAIGDTSRSGQCPVYRKCPRRLGIDPRDVLARVYWY